MAGEKRIYKRPDSRYWWIRYFVNGKIVRESSKSIRKGDAIDLLDKRLGERIAGVAVVGSARLDDALELWVKDAELRELRGIAIFRRARTLILEFLGNMKLRDVKTPAFMELQHGLKTAGYAPATINNVVGMLRTALRVGARAGMLLSVPESPRRVEGSERREGFLEHEDYEAIAEALPDWVRDPFEFTYYTGWRWQEVFWLEWDEVDLIAREIRLPPRRSKTKKGRVWPIRLLLRPIIERRIAARIPELKYVFHAKGAQINRSSFYRAWRKACGEAERPGTLLHDCRRTAVRNLERAGVRRAVAMQLVGHTTEAMYRKYDITSEREFAEAETRLVNYFDREAGNARVIPFGKK